MCNPPAVINSNIDSIALRMKGTKCVIETPTSEDMPDVKVMNENAHRNRVNSTMNKSKMDNPKSKTKEQKLTSPFV